MDPSGRYSDSEQHFLRPDDPTDYPLDTPIKITTIHFYHYSKTWTHEPHHVDVLFVLRKLTVVSDQQGNVDPNVEGLLGLEGMMVLLLLVKRNPFPQHHPSHQELQWPPHAFLLHCSSPSAVLASINTPTSGTHSICHLEYTRKGPSQVPPYAKLQLPRSPAHARKPTLGDLAYITGWATAFYLLIAVSFDEFRPPRSDRALSQW